MRKFFASLFSRPAQAAALVALLSLGATFTASAAEPLVNVQWLNEHLHDKNLVVLDIRSAIDGGGAKAYEAAHIPGSVHSDYDKAGWR
ncbi:MAG TPA: rhodanese-like domain-containing protein, partial [Pseudolabrys sp.]|nr:rhodanese-like domain-containing protein [Pseudolabrys sp.]